MIKKISTLFLVLLISFFALNAKEIPQNEAEIVAKNFIFEQQGLKQNSIQFITETISKENSNFYYIFNIKEGGFVIVSAEDNFDPILAYSFDSKFETKNMPENISWWMNIYVEQIQYIRSTNITTQNANLWSKYNVSFSDFSLKKDTPKTEVILETALWNQDAGWNNYCPADATSQAGNGRVYAGCVATAMGIIMKYWNYPFNGQGSNSYYCYPYGTLSANFGTTNYMWEYMSNSTPDKYNALLIYHLGVAVDMNYGPDGSGAYSVDADDVMRNNFYYNNAQYVSKSSYTSENWITLIKGQIDAGKPVYYSGQGDDGGHAFVVDGYRTDDNFFHFNFGWSGTDNGFYAHTDANGFPTSQAVIINIIPTQSYYPYSNAPTDFVAELDTNQFTQFSSSLAWTAPVNKAITGYKLFRDDVNIESNLSSSTSSYSDNPSVIGNHDYCLRGIYTNGPSLGAPTQLKGQFIVNFRVTNSSGSNVHQAAVTFNDTTIMTGFGSAQFKDVKWGSNYEYSIVKDNLQAQGTIEHVYKDMIVYVTIYPVGIKENSQIIVAYPNPTNGIVVLQGLDNNNKVIVYDMTGKAVFESSNVQNNSPIDLTYLKTGVYIMNINSNGEVINHNIVIK